MAQMLIYYATDRQTPWVPNPLRRVYGHHSTDARTRASVAAILRERIAYYKQELSSRYVVVVPGRKWMEDDNQRAFIVWGKP